MKKVLIVLVICLILLGAAMIFAPARLASKALESAFPRESFSQQRGEQKGAANQPPEVRLLGASGTLWDGAGKLLVNRAPIGDLSWQVQASKLLSLEAAVDWQLQGSSFSAQGTAAARGEEYDLRSLRAQISEPFLREALATYDISPSGRLAIDGLDITNLRLNDRMDWPAQIDANGEVRWTGGPVRYRLAGQTFDIELPPMIGTIESPQEGKNPGWPQLRVTNAEDGSLLMTGRLTPTGSAAIGITKGFTRLAGQPWPGSEPDHAVVLEVEEQLN